MPFRPDPIKEHAYLVELAAALHAWREAEANARELAHDALSEGCRADVIAEAVGMSRSTLYRWIG